jgi:hypothetical protein
VLLEICKCVIALALARSNHRSQITHVEGFYFLLLVYPHQENLQYELCHALPNASVIPMDGFRLTHQLAKFPDPANALKRRGSPFTFDPSSLLSYVFVKKARDFKKI